MIFQSRRGLGADLYTRTTDGDRDQLLLDTPLDKTPMDVSADDLFLLYGEATDLWVLPLTGPPTPRIVAKTAAVERQGQFSPDVHWLAYDSNESGRPEVYLQPFPGPGGRVPVSTDGGAEARWNPDGSELFYLSRDRHLMSVSFHARPNGGAPDVGKALPVFAKPLTAATGGNGHDYDVSRDGKRFLFNILAGPAEPASLNVILNWRGRP